MKRKVIGIGSVDAHSKLNLFKQTKIKRLKKAIIRFPKYEPIFNIVHTDIVTREAFTGDFEHDRRIVFDALQNGSCYLGFYGIENPRGFRFTASSGDEEAIIGEELILRNEAELKIILPDNRYTRITVVCNGKRIARFYDSPSATLSVAEEGVYRVEVEQYRRRLPFMLKHWYPWILTNPIRIKTHSSDFHKDK
jgi:hypothetical protein